MDSLASLHRTPATWLHNSELGAFASTYCQHLVDRGYAACTRRTYLCCVAHFARWTGQCGVLARDLTDEDIGRFLHDHLPHCRCPAPVQRSPHQIRAALRQLLTALRNAGILVESHSFDVVEDELSRFDEHMRSAQGLAANTRMQRLRIVRAFLHEKRDSGSVQPTPLNADDLRHFINQHLLRWSPASAHVLATALRGYLRFLVVSGKRVEHLLPVITSPANWRLAALPQTLSASEVKQLLDSFVPDAPSAYRAYAMVRCVVDLGLRASEVIGLELDDIDWPTGTIRISQNKSRRVDVMPLPEATGDAIANYLRLERPATISRRLFVRHVAPVDDPIGPGVVRRAVRDAYQRCGLSHTRVHLLRHTLACRILAGHGTLKEVADVLRHRSLDTSVIYAKIDEPRLSAVALPWPGSVS